MTATLVRVAARKKRLEPSAAGYSVSEVSSAFGCVGSGAASIGDDLEPGQPVAGRSARCCRGL